MTALSLSACGAAGSGAFDLATGDAYDGADANNINDGATPDGAVAGFAAMPLISRGKPAFANYSANPAASAVDGDYGTEWRSGHDATASDPNWIAIDLSSVPAAQRANVYSLWFNEAGYNYETADAASYALAGDFRIEGHAAAGGGQPPTTGWSTLVTVTGNTLGSGANLLALSGYNWVRFVCTAAAKNVAVQNTDTGLQWDLHDASRGLDAWKFGGDSITANSMSHQPSPANDSFNQLVAGQRSVYFPAFEMAGHGFWDTTMYLAVIDAYLANFPGRFFGLALGTNDVGANPATYNANLSSLIDKIVAAGKVPVLPTIPYTGDPQHLSAIPSLNAEVQKLYIRYGAKLVQGPDLYSVLYNGRATMFNMPTDLHPNATGDAAIRKAWADTMVKQVYP